MILPARTIKVVRLPVKLNQTLEFKDLGSLPRGVIFSGGLRRYEHSLLSNSVIKRTVQYIWVARIVYVECFSKKKVYVKDILDQVKPCKHVHTEVMDQQTLAQRMQMEFPAVLGKSPRCVRHYQAGRMRFRGEVPADGGKQVDFSRGARPIVLKLIQEWLEAGVMNHVTYRPKCISPLLLIPNVKKSGFRACHDLWMLYCATVKEWGPLMDQMERLQSLPLFSSLILPKGSCKSP